MRTSYFANLKNIEYPISICGRAPEFYSGPQYKKVAPKIGFFKEFKDPESEHYMDTDYYIENFNSQVLSVLNPDVVYKELCSIYPDVNPDEITLICYEKPNDFCHRHLVAAWLTKGGHETHEMATEKKINSRITSLL